MSEDKIIQAAETIQTASIHPSPHPPQTDVNPKTRRFHRVPSASDAGSLSTDIVNPSRSVSRLSRRPPLPDLRFEQSYLASLGGAETWGRIAWITMRDQVLLPLIQGTLWTLALSGIRYWNRGASVSGRRLGTAMRQLWGRVYNWKPARS